MAKSKVIYVRSNCSFQLDYETSTLTPKAELVLVAAMPVYKFGIKGLVKTHECEDIRVDIGRETLNELIAELQHLSTVLNQFDQLSTGLNKVIEAQVVIEKRKQ
jgi:predicted N-formylglutamate amidohydrolase